jgi:hypothetical protein
LSVYIYKTVHTTYIQRYQLTCHVSSSSARFKCHQTNSCMVYERIVCSLHAAIIPSTSTSVLYSFWALPYPVNAVWVENLNVSQAVTIKLCLITLSLSVAGQYICTAMYTGVCRVIAYQYHYKRFTCFKYNCMTEGYILDAKNERGKTIYQ